MPLTLFHTLFPLAPRVAFFFAFAIPVAAAERALKSDAEITEVFAGHTVSGTDDGEAYQEYLSPDGRIMGKGSDGAYEGAWQVYKGRLCFHYAEEPARKWDCSQVAVDGNRIIWDGDRKNTATLSSGKSF